MVHLLARSLDSRHYKKGDSKSKTLPVYFQMGTVIESASDFFTGRLNKKRRVREQLHLRCYLISPLLTTTVLGEGLTTLSATPTAACSFGVGSKKSLVETNSDLRWISFYASNSYTTNPGLCYSACGPFYPVLTGRRDNIYSYFNKALAEIP
nr:hypothetical protein CFP56_05868 [Quercus suber]